MSAVVISYLILTFVFSTVFIVLVVMVGAPLKFIVEHGSITFITSSQDIVHTLPPAHYIGGRVRVGCSVCGASLTHRNATTLMRSRLLMFYSGSIGVIPL